MSSTEVERVKLRIYFFGAQVPFIHFYLVSLIVFFFEVIDLFNFLLCPLGI